MTPLDYIRTTVKTKSAVEYAFEKVIQCVLFGEDYMRDMYGGAKNEALEQLKQKCYLDHIKGYSDMCLKFVGFETNGSLFVLDKREKFVCFIYDIREHENGQTSADMYIHYNPLKVDIIEQSVPSKFIFDDFENWSISKDEQSIIKECDELISNVC
jgi:hypothetical protein